MKLIEKLRESTKDQHAKLDQISEMKQLTSESVKKDDYKNYLLAFLSIYLAIESEIYDFSSKYLEGINSNERLSHLKNDLKYFDVEKASLNESKKIDLNNSEYLGALYVMEGSRLGGNLIGKHLLSHLNLEKSDVQFLVSRPAVKWSQIISFLNDQPLENHDEIVIGAKKVFQYFYDELSHYYERMA